MIYPKVLNIHKDSEWSKEFGLEPLELKTLLFSSTMDFVVALGATGLYFQLFPGREQVSAKFSIGKELKSTDMFVDLRDVKNINDDYFIYDQESRTSSFEKVKKASKEEDLEQLIYIPVLQSDNRFLGFMVLYFFSAIDVTKIHETLIRQFRDNIILRLNLSREKRLRRDISEIQDLIANSNEHPIFAKDKEFRIVYANDAFLEFYPPEQRDKVIGYTTLESYDPAEVEEFLQEDRVAFESGLTKTVERISFPSGKIRVLETTKRRFKTSAGTEYILGVSYDLTERIVLIEQLKKRNAELDKFSNIASQDLRGPLNSILKLLDWTLEDLDPIANEEAIDNLHQIKTKATRIHTLLDDLFDYSYAGREIHDAKPLSLRSFVMKIAPKLNFPESTKLAIDDIELNLPHNPFEVVMLNLLGNAIQHADAEQLDIAITAKKESNEFLITVQDNGIGIDEKDHKVVFQLFETLAPQFERAGSGKGLALVKKIVETYQGSVSLDSQIGKGCRFEIRWPLISNV
ncbi:PAS domain-containing protein [Glaciecola sp. MH2013]|uniref:sensor histidine kinase n=1 Tax=Glaciecola sp. MH2013 TaxID=2785524 RepID=UPI0018A0D638|nr:ATP-binding protein [Glaciecola sp. MH2013]MBF7072024.1 PAS domain-containing protein [Glaciecola sp. MH2013]